jgi:hypothetical protein
MILARQLQALREKAGLSYEQAAEAIYSSEWTIRRMERAEGGLKPLTVKSLPIAYGITDAREICTFVALARNASKPGWWHSYDDILPPWFKIAIGLEESATVIRAYHARGCAASRWRWPGRRRRRPAAHPRGGSRLWRGRGRGNCPRAGRHGRSR